jgi:ATP/maltotriose-dependent transcriptional regulator MalT
VGAPRAELRQAIVEIAEACPDASDDCRPTIMLAFAEPVGRAREVAARLARSTSTGPDQLVLLGFAALSIWAPETALELASRALADPAIEGRRTFLFQSLSIKGQAAIHLARPGMAGPAAEEALALARQTGSLNQIGQTLVVLAFAAGERGDTETVDSSCSEAEQVLLSMGAHPAVSMVQLARGRAAIAGRRFDDAYRELSRIFDPGDVAHQPYVRGWVIVDFVDAALHADGDVEAARRELAEVESMAASSGSSFLDAQMSHAQALLAPDDEKERCFHIALEHPWSPGNRGRVLLDYGAWLRRQRRVAESRAPLKTAEELLAGVGLVVRAEHARHELRATGETVRKRTPDAWAQLTAQELQIAQLAASGMTNREIGQRLFLSHRTIGSHLYRIFPKLGITTRNQLRDAIPEHSLA